MGSIDGVVRTEVGYERVCCKIDFSEIRPNILAGETTIIRDFSRYYQLLEKAILQKLYFATVPFVLFRCSNKKC